MHIAAYTMVTGKTIPALKRLRDAIDANSKKWVAACRCARLWLRIQAQPMGCFDLGRVPGHRGLVLVARVFSVDV